MAGTDIANTIDEYTVALTGAIDPLLAPVDSGPLASRPPSTAPSPGKLGRHYYATDLGVTFLDYGTGWIALNEPIGNVTWWAGAGAPSGGTHVEANGQAISRSTYPLYMSLIGTLHGAGNGSTTVNVPDLVGRTAVGRDPSATRIPNNPRAVGQGGGEERHLSTAAESGVNGNGSTGNDTPDHTHGLGGTALRDSASFQNWQLPGGAGREIEQFSATAGASTRHTHPLIARNADAAHNNMQPYLALTPIVRVA
ncbi:phage tail protein [Baekduia alba]|uniref:phage tail protein n=1 Tax=Baekduia alba TaxID=2997333 RepID=UPI002340154D|nr:phage tail protein [Baekduia alba]